MSTKLSEYQNMELGGWRYKWLLPPPTPKFLIERLSRYSPLVLQALNRRGMSDPRDIESFLERDIRPENLQYIIDHLSGVQKAITRIRQAISRNEPITVYGDFDVDGVTSTVLLVQVIRALGGNVDYYIPNRVDEGYGLNIDSLGSLARTRRGLVITVDCGIRSINEIEWANNRGIDVIITDHHSVGDQLPHACAVINPKQPHCKYRFKSLSGVGVSYKLAYALVEVSRKAEPKKHARTQSLLRDVLDLVALGTISDMVPLVDENRQLVRMGLEQLAETQRPGIKALMKVSGITPDRIDSESVSFVLGPRLNAAGRLRNASLSYDLLQTSDDAMADSLAQKLERLNQERQRLTNEHYTIAQEEINKTGSDKLIYLIAHQGFHPGVVGLVASRLVEQYYRPAIVIELGPATSRGSARSIAEFNITWALDQCRDLLVRHGGHEGAAGFTVETEKLGLLSHRLQVLAEEQLRAKKEDLRPKLEIDGEVSLGDVDFALAGMLKAFQPTGYQNPPPKLLSRNVSIKDERQVGADGAHLKLAVSDPTAGGPRSNMTFDAIAFRQGHWYGNLPRSVDLVAIAFRQGHWYGKLPRAVDLVYSLEENVWNGNRRLQLVVEDLRAAERD